jgi:hypothetical protein
MLQIVATTSSKQHRHESRASSKSQRQHEEVLNLDFVICGTPIVQVVPFRPPFVMTELERGRLGVGFNLRIINGCTREAITSTQVFSLC